MSQNAFRIQFYSLQELAAAYGISKKVLRRWLSAINENLGPRIGHMYTPRQVRVIVEKFGEPGGGVIGNR